MGEKYEVGGETPIIISLLKSISSAAASSKEKNKPGAVKSD
jgi:hypothetical protein